MLLKFRSLIPDRFDPSLDFQLVNQTVLFIIFSSEKLLFSIMLGKL